ncbi:MAG: PAS domain-containing protein [Cyanobacteria bacterium J06638_7]
MASNLERLIDAAPAHIYLKDAEGRVLFVNQATATALAQAKEELIGGLDRDHLPPEQMATIRDHDLAVLQSGTPQSFQMKLDFPGGSKTMVDHKFPVTLEDGSTGVGGIAVVVEGSST